MVNDGAVTGGAQPWKFKCKCGQECSSYERVIFHPTGQMFECTHCSFWSHTDCVLGKISDADLEKAQVGRVFQSMLLVKFCFRYF